MKSLRDLYTELGENRTTVQYWVDKILCRPKQDEKDNTPLQFSDKEVQKLWITKLYKQLNYSNEEIRKIISCERFDFDKALDEHISELNHEKERIERMINLANSIKLFGVTPHSINFGYFNGTLNFNESLSALSNLELNNSIDIEISDFEQIQVLFFELGRLFKCKIGFVQDEVQEVVRNIHKLLIPYISESILCFDWCIKPLLPNAEFSNRFDAEFGRGCGKYVYNALTHYCQDNKSDLDLIIPKALGKLYDLSVNNAEISSPEVQEAIDEICTFLSNIKSCETTFQRLKALGKNLSSEPFTRIINEGGVTEVIDFINNAIDYYCKDKENKP